jgi:hypothetical protein
LGAACPGVLKAFAQFFGQIVYMTGERYLQVTVIFLEHLRTFQCEMAWIILRFARFEEGPIWMNFVLSFLQRTH